MGVSDRYYALSAAAYVRGSLREMGDAGASSPLEPPLGALGAADLACLLELGLEQGLRLHRAYGSIIALQGVPVAVAAGVGPVVAGVLYDHLGGYMVSFSLCAAAFLLAAAVVALTPRPPGPPSR